jgi:hypothetical protein
LKAPEPPRSPARRLLSGLVAIVSVVGITALFGVGVTAGLLGHLNLPAGRRATAKFLGSTLVDLFQGEVTIGAITKVSPDEVSAEDVVVRDKAHRIVLKVTRLTAQADVLDILTRIFRGDPKLTIKIDHVRIERAEAEIIEAEDGLPTLAHALTPRPTPGPSTPSSSEQYVRVWLPAIEIGQGFARGSLGGSPTLETELSGVHGSVLATPKGAAIDVERFALLARGVGGADAKGIATLHIRAPGAVWSSFDGYMGEVQFGSVGRWEKQALDLKVDFPRAEPAQARALVAQWPLLAPAEARVHLKGKPPDLDVELWSKIGDAATLNATGTLSTASPVRLQLDVEGRKLDLRALWANAPPTSIDVDSDVGIHGEAGKVVVELGGALAPTTLSGYAIPPIDFSGKASDGSFTGEAKLHDLGLPVEMGFTVHADGKIDVDAEAKRVNLAKVERIKPYFDGSGSADMRVHATFDHGRLDTNLSLDVRGLNYQGVALQSGRLTAGARGSIDKLDQLALDARVSGKKLSAGRFEFEDVSATARGPLRTTTVTTNLVAPNGPSFDARAIVALGKPVSVRELSLGVSRDNVEIRGEVAQLDLAEDRVLIRNLRLHGATGELNGDAELTPQTLSVTAQGQNLDLSAISRVMGLPRGVLEGRASLSIDALTSGKTQRGNLELSVNKATISGLSDITGQLSAKLDGHRLTGASTGRIEALGGFSADWDTQLAGPPTVRSSFERATGSGTISLNDVTLDYLGQLFPEENLDVAGQATVSLHVARSDPDAVPDLELSGQTNGLSVRIARPKQTPVVLSGIELMASATHHGQSGNTSLALSANQGSERLVTTSGDLTLDLKAAVSGKEALLHQLQNRPLLAKIVVSRLDLDNLPGQLRVPGLRGTVRLEGTVRGSASAPIASLGVRAADLRFALGDRAEPIDVCGSAEYAQESGAFNVGAEVFLPDGMQLARTPCGGKRIANVRLTGRAPFDFKTGIPSWSGTALATLEALPLATIPQLADARVSGTASGTVLLDRSGQQPNASAQLQLADVRMDRLDVGDGTLKLRSDGARAHVDFAIQRGLASVNGGINAGLSWSSELPALDDAAPIDLTLSARKLEASILEPFLSDFVSELRGTLNGSVSARLEPLAKGEESRRVEQVGGNIRLNDGSFVFTGLGFRLRDVDFSANATRDGKTTLVDVPDFVATAGSKVHNLQSHLAFRLSGFDIVSGSVSLNVKSLPLVVDGITRATADVDISHLTITRDADRILVDVPFDRLLARLPGESSRTLTDLDENENITLLQPVAEPNATRGEAAIPWQFAIHLGNNAKLERGEQIDLPIAGDPNVVLAAGLGVTGSVLLQRHGSVQLLGKTFVIEGGAIVFDTPDPADPRLDVRASWRSATSDTLFMYVSGTLSHPKVQFDRPPDQALALLRGGTETGTTDIGFGVLDTLLADTPLARVQLRGQDSQDSTHGATYTAAYRLDDRIVVEGNYQAAGTSGDQGATAGAVGAAVDWRLTKTISLRGQLGTIGTGVDLVYQYRY